MTTIIDLLTMREAPLPEKTVLCLGNFDGVHLGHRALIREALKVAASKRCKGETVATGILCFRTHPSLYLHGKTVALITPTEQKLCLFASYGVEYAILVDFEDVREDSPSAFVRKLVNDYHCDTVVCGYNFRFGKDAEGDTETLSREMNGNCHIVPGVSVAGKTVHSSLIRDAIQSGDMSTANMMLGYDFFICSEVVHGKSLGHTLGIPTINQFFPEGGLTPEHGVYASSAEIDGMLFPSVSNIGTRPSFDDGDRVNCETHIIGYDGDLYNQKVKVSFREKMRNEIKFDSVDSLLAQLKNDIEKASSLFKETKGGDL